MRHVETCIGLPIWSSAQHHVWCDCYGNEGVAFWSQKIYLKCTRSTCMFVGANKFSKSVLAWTLCASGCNHCALNSQIDAHRDSSFPNSLLVSWFMFIVMWRWQCTWNSFTLKFVLIILVNFWCLDWWTSCANRPLCYELIIDCCWCDILCDLRTQLSCTIGTMTMCVVEPLIVCEPLYVTCV